MDKRGEGVPVILSASGRRSGVRPEYKLLGESELLLTIRSAPVDDRTKLREIVLKKNIQARGQVMGQVAENTPVRDQVADQVGVQVRGQVERLLYAIKDRELTVSELMGLMGVTSRAHFREDVIVPALADGYIEMTQPNSPRSPTQKYRITEKGRLVVSR